MNMALKRSLSRRHDIREKWLETTFKLQKTSAFKELAGISILSTAFDFEIDEEPCFCSDDCFWKKGSSYIWPFVLNQEFVCFLPAAWLVNPSTPMLEISKSFWQKLQYAFVLLTLFFNHLENLESLNQ